MRKLILFILLCSMGISGYKVTNTLLQYKQADNYYEEIQHEVIKTIPTPTAAIKPNLRHTTEQLPPIEIDFQKLQEINTEIIGWIYSENTVINYPVLHTSNNVYYLKHLMDNQYSINGSIFLDTINDTTFSDENAILYGHHMKNGSMFASIEDYKEQEYYDEHQTLWLLTPTQNYQIAPFAGLVVSSSHQNYFITNFEDEIIKQQYIDEAIELSTFNSNMRPNISDKFITLTTCDYTFENARFILIGILIPVVK